MKIVVKILLSALAVLGLSYLLGGVTVTSFKSAVYVAIVLGLLRAIVRPILVVLTLPITVLTLGLFLFVINAIIIFMASNIIDGFTVNGIFTAIIFSLLLSISQSFLYKMLEDDKSAKY
jgi:putative membrane protein